jgi:hypothetical protein
VKIADSELNISSVRTLPRADYIFCSSVPSTFFTLSDILVSWAVMYLAGQAACCLISKGTTFPHRDIHKHTCTSPDGVTRNQIDHVLLNKRRHSNILDVRSFRGADCDTDHYLVVTKLRERISVRKRTRQNFHLEKFDLKKLDDVEVKEKYQVEISNKFAALENLDESFDINNA